MLAKPARERGESPAAITAPNSTLAHARSAPLSLRRYASLPSPPEGGEGGARQAIGCIGGGA
jgi:hypothetical protein